jgi:hypothetical protein
VSLVVNDAPCKQASKYSETAVLTGVDYQRGLEENSLIDKDTSRRNDNAKPDRSKPGATVKHQSSATAVWLQVRNNRAVLMGAPAGAIKNKANCEELTTTICSVAL